MQARYTLYRQGKYWPSEDRPKIVMTGRRKWYAPWSRHPDQVWFGMSEAMAFRAQDAQFHFAAPIMPAWCNALGLTPNASPDQIKSAYRAKAAVEHPDKGGSDAAMSRLNAARDQGLKERG